MRVVPCIPKYVVAFCLERQTFLGANLGQETQLSLGTLC